MTSEFEENDIEETAEEEAEEEAEYETEEEVGEEAEEEAEYETEEEAEYENEEEAESETEENQVDDTETGEQQIEKNIEREVEQEETNTKKRSWVWEHFTYDETVKKAKCKHCKILIACNKGSTSGMAGHIKTVESDLSQRYIYYDSEDKHVRCLAHVINLAAQQVLTTLKATDNDESSNEEVASPQQVDKFKAQCKVANVPNLNVILDVRTRWNSTYDMLVRARKLKEPLNILSNSDSNLRPFTINEDEWINLLEIEELLKYFAKATKQICGETYPTLSYVIPIYNILLNKLEDFRDTPNRFENGKEAAINAINKLKIYYNKTDSTLYAVSLILDPRLKVEYMKDNEWETQWVDRTKKTVSELYITLYAPQETQNTNIEYNSSDEDLVHIFPNGAVLKLYLDGEELDTQENFG
ncbi:unnamed protein product [Rhizophagus irregularis]|nr:unnamed protein product [Rhizophagus irregularis]